MNNLELWNKVKTPPETALKKIGGGRLAGMTDINPQWRYLCLTEHWGPVGKGWKYTVDKKWTENGPNGVVMAFVDISLYVKYPGDAEWCDPIPGHGGSMLIADESKGLRASDEGYKMATTDALSVACKMLGIGSDVYEGKMDGNRRPAGTKYDNAPEYDQTRGEGQRKPVQQHPPVAQPTAQPAAQTASPPQQFPCNVIDQKQRAELRTLLKKQCIKLENWVAWLGHFYHINTSELIGQDQYPAILRIVKDMPAVIAEFKVTPATREPGQD